QPMCLPCAERRRLRRMNNERASAPAPALHAERSAAHLLHRAATGRCPTSRARRPWAQRRADARSPLSATSAELLRERLLAAVGKVQPPAGTGRWALEPPPALVYVHLRRCGRRAVEVRCI